MMQKKTFGSLLAATIAIGQCGKTVAADPQLEEVLVAIGGYCPVSYQTAGEPTRGTPNFASEYNGYTYFMASAKAKELFDKAPARYAPQIGGLCTLALGGPYGNKFAGDPRVFAVVDRKLYLLSSQRAKRAFDQNPVRYILRAAELYNEPAIGGYCPVSYAMENKAAKGKKEFAREFRGNVYHFASEKALNYYKEKGARAMPRYDGLCAEGVSRGKTYPADPMVIAVVAEKVLLFFDEAAKTKFIKNAAALMEEADRRWPAIRMKAAPPAGP